MDVWENGSGICPQLKDWSVAMRNYRSGKRSNTSLYSQRKFIYIIFMACDFDQGIVQEKHSEIKPGKLYKALKTKHT